MYCKRNYDQVLLSPAYTINATLPLLTPPPLLEGDRCIQTHHSNTTPYGDVTTHETRTSCLRDKVQCRVVRVLQYFKGSRGRHRRRKVLKIVPTELWISCNLYKVDSHELYTIIAFITYDIYINMSAFIIEMDGWIRKKTR